MDGSRFDALARTLAGPRSRRGVLAGLAGVVSGAWTRNAGAACPPDQVARRGLGCICRATGRPPVGGDCPCPRGQKRCGAGAPCVLQATCCGDADCPAGQCLTCDLGSGTCQSTCAAPATCGGTGQPGVCGNSQGTCAAGADNCVGENVYCNGANQCRCNQTVAGATFCANEGQCFLCTSDSDCVAVTGPGSACLVIDGVCTGCVGTGQRACAAPCPVAP